jgi:hypothetical protein
MQRYYQLYGIVPNKRIFPYFILDDRESQSEIRVEKRRRMRWE